MLSLLENKLMMLLIYSLPRAATSVASFNLFIEISTCIENIVANEMR
jgi:hypothetical protein